LIHQSRDLFARDERSGADEAESTRSWSGLGKGIELANRPGGTDSASARRD
jgi:hypothetical protein